MWYQTFNKETWQLRVFRKQNLKFNQDDVGMYRTKFLTRWKEFIFRMCRSEGALRGSMGLIGFGMIPILMFIKTKYYQPYFVEPKMIKDAENLKQIDQIARDTLLYNKFGAPTRPHRNMDDMMNFLSGSETYDDLFDFVSY
jgi:hypothetical protein